MAVGMAKQTTRQQQQLQLQQQQQQHRKCAHSSV
jgi:hypothetical protein